MITQAQNHFKTLSFGFAYGGSRDTLLPLAIKIQLCILHVVRSRHCYHSSQFRMLRQMWRKVMEMFAR